MTITDRIIEESPLEHKVHIVDLHADIDFFRLYVREYSDEGVKSIKITGNLVLKIIEMLEKHAEEMRNMPDFYIDSYGDYKDGKTYESDE